MTDAPISFVPTGDTGRQLRDAFGRFATGVTVVTAQGPDGPSAITANSFASVSLDPALVLWSPSRTSRRFDLFTNVTHYAIHVLAADQHDLCWSVAKDRQGFDMDTLGRNENGVPILADCLARFDCARYAVHDGGDHAIVVGQILRATYRSGTPLAFYGGKMVRLSEEDLS